MAGFKRVPLRGSDELFRPTREEAEAAQLAREEPREPVVLTIKLTPEEMAWVVDSLQLARYPERARPRPTITQFERLGELQDRLRRSLEPEDAV